MKKADISNQLEITMKYDENIPENLSLKMKKPAGIIFAILRCIQKNIINGKMLINIFINKSKKTVEFLMKTVGFINKKIVYRLFEKAANADRIQSFSKELYIADNIIKG